ncbi:hypothetical protein [Flavobacterium sharifuzzamanii]|uniref:hypothetical protein n=1 Tax=Flavobacterium sharifuzzamanii TaxID=2211133 RepID=UPI000DAD042D|nr:hypothetical protein [Flavobacterium sharifuzzamanii]KAF2082031.1 hypothetical protein DMA14_06055 [Flavobacterium sharifuzzamanii]
MRVELKKVLSQWRNDENKIGIRKVYFSNFPGSEFEYLITLTEELNVTINNFSKLIFVKQRFQTFAQENNGKNPEGDIFRAVNNIKLITDNFDKTYDEAINELLADYLGNDNELD